MPDCRDAVEGARRSRFMHSLMMLAGIAIGFVALPVCAQTPDLSPLATQLEKIRNSHGINEERDAGPEFTPVKQALRAWVEQQLPPVPGTNMPDGTTYSLDADDLTSLSTRLTQALDAALLTCGRPASTTYRCAVADPTAFENDRGHLDEIRIASLDDRYLLVVTGVGMRCGFDQSAYIYEEGTDNHWRLLMAIEQDRYGKDEYKPQKFLSIETSPSTTPWNEASPLPLVNTLGYSPWCSSNRQSLYTKLWHASKNTTTPAALIDRDDSLYTADDFVAAAHLTNHDLLVEFTGASIDGDALVRRHVLHYRVGPGHAVERIAPAALDPQAFVEEWLTSPWAEASRWLSPAADRSAWARLHSAERQGDRFGEFDGPPKRCRLPNSLWQVTFTKDSGRGTRPTYFKVQWLATYDFSLVAASTRPFRGCNETATPESTIGTLFPRQGWTQ
jgi:hypothetical protein